MSYTKACSLIFNMYGYLVKKNWKSELALEANAWLLTLFFVKLELD